MYMLVATTPDESAAADYASKHLCGCGIQEYLVDGLKKILDCFLTDPKSSDMSPMLARDAFKTLIPQPEIQELILHWLDHQDLTAHGSSVWGSWLTKYGEAIKTYVNRYPEFDHVIEDISPPVPR